MRIHIYSMTLDETDDFFPATDEDGRNCKATKEAEVLARGLLSASEEVPISWHIPDVFSVRYGSSYLATARVGDAAVRFLVEDNEGVYFSRGDDENFLAK